MYYLYIIHILTSINPSSSLPPALRRGGALQRPVPLGAALQGLRRGGPVEAAATWDFCRVLMGFCREFIGILDGIL